MNYCSAKGSGCSNAHPGATISLRDKGSSVNLVVKRKNVSPLCVHLVDGGLIPKGNTACDYLITSCNTVELFAELKGSSIMEGVAQLEASMRKLMNRAVATRHAYIVSSRFPPMIDTRVQKAQKRFREEFAATLTVKNRFAEITI